MSATPRDDISAPSSVDRLWAFSYRNRTIVVKARLWYDAKEAAHQYFGKWPDDNRTISIRVKSIRNYHYYKCIL